MKRGGRHAQGRDVVGRASGVEWYEKGDARRAHGAFAQVSWHVIGDVGRWVWWLRIPLLTPGVLFGALFVLVFMSPLLAVILVAGYRRGERLQALKDGFTGSSGQQGFTWQSLRPPRTHVIRNLRSLLIHR